MGEALPVNMWYVGEIIGAVLLVCFVVWKFRNTMDAVYLAGYSYFTIMSVLVGNLATAGQLTLFMLFYKDLSHKWIGRIIYTLWVLFALDAIWLLSGHKFGLLNAMTFDASIMGILCIPLFAKLRYEGFKNKWLLALLVLFAVTIFHFTARTGFLAFTVGMLGYYFKRGHTKKVIGISLAALAIIAMWRGMDFLHSGGRWFMWDRYITWFHDNNGDKLLGFGQGMFKHLTVHMPIKGTIYLFMHNDYLQLWFEQGWVGAIVFGIVMIHAGLKAYAHTALAFGLFLAFSLTMFLYFPMHFFLSQLLGLCILRMADNK